MPSKLHGTLGIETASGLFAPIVHRGTILPIDVKHIITTWEDNQPEIEIEILFGQNRQAVQNTVVAAITLDQIESAPRGRPRIEIRITVDKNLQMIVSAKDLKIGYPQKTEPVDLSLVYTPQSVTPGFDDFIEEFFAGPTDMSESIPPSMVVMRFGKTPLQATDVIYEVIGKLREPAFRQAFFSSRDEALKEFALSDNQRAAMQIITPNSVGVYYLRTLDKAVRNAADYLKEHPEAVKCLACDGFGKTDMTVNLLVRSFEVHPKCRQCNGNGFY